MYSQEDLMQLYNEATMYLTKKQFSDFHLRSAKNFIYHLHSIPSEKDKYFTSEKMNEYLLIIKNVNEDIMIHESMNVYQSYIKPIGLIYEHNIGFVTHMKLWIFFSWYLLLMLGAYLLVQSLIVLAIISLSFSIYFTVMRRKRGQNKTYAFKY